MARAPAATAARPCTGPVARLLAVLLALAVLVSVSPRSLVAAAPPVAAAPAGEESETETESVSPACPRRSAGLTGFAAAGLPAASPTYCAGPAPPSPVPDSSPTHVARGTFRPHPRC